MMDQATDKRSPIIGGALILTVGFLALFVALLSVGKLPDGCVRGLWLIDRLSCLEPNALGDTFAGAFAPVAFVWLVAAVLLQRNELAAQRQELREGRRVAAEQVEEARKNVRLIEIQTEILAEQRKSSAQQDADSDLVELCATAVKLFANMVTGTVINDGPIKVPEQPWKPIPPNISFYALSGENDLERLGGIHSQILDAHIELHKMVRDGADIQYRGLAFIVALNSVLEDISLLMDEVSLPVRAELTRIGVKGVHETAVSMAEIIKAQGNDFDREADLP